MTCPTFQADRDALLRLFCLSAQCLPDVQNHHDYKERLMKFLTRNSPNVMNKQTLRYEAAGVQL